MDIKKIYFEILAKVIERRDIKRATLIEALYSGEYLKGELNGSGVETFSLHSYNLGCIIYRGSQGKRHAFYLVSGNDLRKVTHRGLIKLAEAQGLKLQKQISNLEVTADHFPWPPIPEVDRIRLDSDYGKLREIHEEIEKKKNRKNNSRSKKDREKQPKSPKKVINYNASDNDTSEADAREKAHLELEERLRKAGKLL